MNKFLKYYSKIFFLRNRPIAEKVSLWVLLSALAFSENSYYIFENVFFTTGVANYHKPVLDSFSALGEWIAFCAFFAFIIFGGKKDQ